MPIPTVRTRGLTVVLPLLLLACGLRAAEAPWITPAAHRLVLRVDSVRSGRSNSPASVEVSPDRSLASAGVNGRFDEHSIEIVAYDALGVPALFDASRRGYERHLLPWRLERFYGSDRLKLHFVLSDENATTVAVYFSTLDARAGRPRRWLGPVGDGDFLREGWKRRELGATHFDCMADLDSDGDLDLFRGGVEPFITVSENVGENRFVDRGRLTSNGSVLTLPHNAANRSWVVPHFHDLDDDGDLDFIPSFMSGPYAGKIVLFENVPAPGDRFAFEDRGALATASGTPIAGGAQAGGWFPSVAFIRGTTGEGDDSDATLDLIVGSNNRCYYYRSAGKSDDGRWLWDEAVALRSDGVEIELFNPCFEPADVDADGDIDLFAAPQSGQIILYENDGVGVDGKPRVPSFAKGRIVAYDERYLQRSTHPRVTAADFTGDGLVDFVVDRAWELSDLDRDSVTRRDFGALFANVGTRNAPRWERRDADQGAPFTERHQPCDALRQSIVRAVDWDDDGRLDVLAGDCDGFVWFYRNVGDGRVPVFASARKLLAGGSILSLADRSGHARPSVSDWNADGRDDLVLSDGAGGVWVYLDEARSGEARLGPGLRVATLDSGGRELPIQRGTRSHVLVCDFDSDGRKDLVFSDQDNPGFWVFLNIGTDSEPRFAAARRLPLSTYVRPNLGSFVDWDGDGRKDLIACEFEHSIRLYRNAGTGAPGSVPEFSNPDGEILVKPFSIMMISGADVVDFNGDGDLDILTGQGHGGSGIRLYERDFIEDSIRGTRPVVTVERFESAGRAVDGRQPLEPSFLDVARRYADAMLEHGRDVYGEVKSGLFLSALDRRRLRPLETRPAPPSGVRRGDRAGLPWLGLIGANPQNDENLLRALYTLTELTGDARYAAAANHEIEWFFKNTQSPVTGLLPWGEHLSWDVMDDRPISSGTSLTHEFARPWVLWKRTFQLAPEAAHRFALGLWKHQIANQKTGAFDRHAPYDHHGPRDGKDFPRHGGFYVHTWAHAYAHTPNPEYLRAIRAVVERFERKRVAGKDGPSSTMGPLDVATAARLVPEELATSLRAFAAEEDRLILRELWTRFRRPDGSWDFPVTWAAGYASGTTADWALLAVARWRQTGDPAFRDLVVAVADAHIDAVPDEDVDVWPMTFAHVISAQVAAYRITESPVYLGEARRLAALAVELYFQDSPLPRASLKTDHYETITGADSLALALLEVHVARSGLGTQVPPNTIDR